MLSAPISEGQESETTVHSPNGIRRRHLSCRFAHCATLSDCSVILLWRHLRQIQRGARGLPLFCSSPLSAQLQPG